MSKTRSMSIVSAEYVAGYVLRLGFSDGHEQTVNFEPFLSSAKHPEIRKYLDLDLFRAFRVVNGDLDWNDFDLVFPIIDLYENRLTPKQKNHVAA